MLRRKTTLILGAGASQEVRLPLGPELKAQIAGLMRVEIDDWNKLKYSQENSRIFAEIERLEQFRDNKKRILTASRQLSKGVIFASSIDNFLDVRRDNPDIELLAKAALVHLILKGERGSDLLEERRGRGASLKPTAIDETWYQEFAQLLFEKVGVGDIEAALSRLSVIDFNYDRCFEQVMFHALTGLYDLRASRAVELLTTIRILKPYGTVGRLHTPAGSSPPAEFGSEAEGRYLHLAAGIRTFAEQMADERLQSEIRQSVTDAEAIVFLGCAYHPQNMDMIHDASSGLMPERDKRRLIFGTTYKMSESDTVNVEGNIKSMFSSRGGLGEPRLFLLDAKCAEFIRQYRRTLSAD